MGKTYEFSNQTAVLIRRLTSALAFAVSILILALWLIGIIPIHHVNSSPKLIVDNLFEILNIGTKPFWYCASRALFSVLYVWLFIASCRDLRSNLLCHKTWWKEENDTQTSRFSATNCVSTSNRILVRFGFLYLISFIVSPFKLRSGVIALFVLVILANLGINVLRLFYLKRNVLDSIIPPLGTLIMLALLLMFMYNVYDVNISYIFARVANLFRTITVFKNFGEGYLLDSFLSLLIIPIFHLVMLYLLSKAYFDSMYYGSYSYDYIETCKKTMSTGIIVTCIIIIIKMVVSKDTNADTFFDMLIQNADMIALCLCVYFSSKSHIMVSQDAPVYDGITNVPQEKQSNEITEENIESNNT